MVWLFRAYGLAAGHNNGFINILLLYNMVAVKSYSFLQIHC